MVDIYIGKRNCCCCCRKREKCPFSITKAFPSITDMEQDTTVEKGSLVVIQSNTEDEDNAKVYLRTETGWEYIVDLSGY